MVRIAVLFLKVASRGSNKIALEKNLAERLCLAFTRLAAEG